MNDQQSDDQYSPEEAQRRFEALVRAAAKTPPLHRKDVPSQRQESKRKTVKDRDQSRGGARK